MFERLSFENVAIELIDSNPLNPRKDLAIDTEQIQSVLRERGWETAVTAYKKEGRYVLLSGHRRKFAAEQLGYKEIPVYVVEAPKSEKEELERLSSSQGGKADWTTFEWAKYIFDLSSHSENWTPKELAYKVGKSETVVRDALRVFKYYSHTDIEKYIEKKNLSVTILASIISFIEKIKCHYPDLVKELSEEMICANLLNKAEYNRLSAAHIRTDRLIGEVTEDNLRRFLRIPKLPYIKLFELSKLAKPQNFESVKQIRLQKLKSIEKDVFSMGYETAKDAEKLKSHLKDLLYQIDLKKMEIELEYELY